MHLTSVGDLYILVLVLAALSWKSLLTWSVKSAVKRTESLRSPKSADEKSAAKGVVRSTDKVEKPRVSRPKAKPPENAAQIWEAAQERKS